MMAPGGWRRPTWYSDSGKETLIAITRECSNHRECLFLFWYRPGTHGGRPLGRMLSSVQQGQQQIGKVRGALLHISSPP